MRVLVVLGFLCVQMNFGLDAMHHFKCFVSIVLCVHEK